MQAFELVFAILYYGVLSLAASGCQKDKCYSAVAIQANSNPNVATRSADCRSILRNVIDDDTTSTITSYSTMTPASITVTETVTSTLTSSTTTTAGGSIRRRLTDYLVLGESSPEVARREYSPLDVRDRYIIKGAKPSYASACKDLQAYAVACLCFGVKPAAMYTVAKTTKTRTVQVTATTATTTLTMTTSTTTTTTITTAAPAPSCGSVGPFILKAYNNPDVADGTTAVVQGSSGDSQYVQFTSGTPDTFTINSACQLVIQASGQIANTDASTNTGPVFFNTRDQISNQGYRAKSCTIDGPSSVLNCRSGSLTSYFSLDSAGDIYISPDTTPPGGTNSVEIRAILQ